MTIQGRPPSSTTSYTITMPGWSSRAADRASRNVRAYSRAICSSSRPSGGFISLTATCRSSSRSRARHTAPIPPRPTSSPSS
ncbi:hypothetical protein BJF79_35810 [Actinomadura sp. CNU-125]|nr:hypothetical protein BJF79_35810 [Actinomadura sp. CNU-125]